MLPVQKASQSVSTDPEYTFHQEAQAIFAADLPSIPLYQRLKVAATRPDFCGFTLDPSSPSALADIETFDYGEACLPLGASSTKQHTLELFSCRILCR